MASGDTAEQNVPPFRIGQGYDVHALVDGRPLILGGVRVPYEKGCILLRRALECVSEAGYRVGNVDATIICQQPKLARFLPEMRAHIAADLGIAVNQINLKAKTNELLGHLGRGEGIAVHAIALVYRT